MKVVFILFNGLRKVWIVFCHVFIIGADHSYFCIKYISHVILLNGNVILFWMIMWGILFITSVIRSDVGTPGYQQSYFGPRGSWLMLGLVSNSPWLILYIVLVYIFLGIPWYFTPNVSIILWPSPHLFIQPHYITTNNMKSHWYNTKLVTFKYLQISSIMISFLYEFKY